MHDSLKEFIRTEDTLMDVALRDKHVFDKEACTLCGDCFHKCPELNLPVALAKEEIGNLINGRN